MRTGRLITNKVNCTSSFRRSNFAAFSIQESLCFIPGDKSGVCVSILVYV